MEILKKAILHNTLLLGGANLQKTLDCKARPDLRLINDPEKQMLYVAYKGDFAMIPYPEVDHMVPADTSSLATLFELVFSKQPTQTVKIDTPPIARGRPKAQASTPMSHVFEGEGAGKTNDR